MMEQPNHGCGRCIGLTIGASSNIGTYLLQPYVARIARTLGSVVNIDLRVAGNPEMAEALTAGELDVAVMEWWDSCRGRSRLGELIAALPAAQIVSTAHSKFPR
jgi:DNA-binding transcriptional LysR family regulator